MCLLTRCQLISNEQIWVKLERTTTIFRRKIPSFGNVVRKIAIIFCMRWMFKNHPVTNNWVCKNIYSGIFYLLYSYWTSGVEMKMQWRTRGHVQLWMIYSEVMFYNCWNWRGCIYFFILVFVHNTMRRWQNGRNFEDDIFKRIFLNEHHCFVLFVTEFSFQGFNEPYANIDNGDDDGWW